MGEKGRATDKPYDRAAWKDGALWRRKISHEKQSRIQNILVAVKPPFQHTRITKWNAIELEALVAIGPSV